MTDTISREAALKSIANALNNATGDLYDAYSAIAALPAVTVGVSEATIHRAVMDWIRDDAGAAVKMSMTPVLANALTARILAALEPQPAPDALDELARLGQEWDADDVELCGKCMGSGYGGHPDSGALCTDCHGKGGIIRRPAPDAQAIREAAAHRIVELKVVRAVDVCNRVLHFDLARMIDFDSDDYNQAVKDAADSAREAYDAIFAMIQKGGA